MSVRTTVRQLPYVLGYELYEMVYLHMFAGGELWR